MSKRFAIIDVETTGGKAHKEKITEIAVVVHDGQQIIETFHSLLNPERPIPYNITLLTGITNEMVAGAPKFYEVAKRLVELTQDAIFVAHNVRFDYSFVQEEFRRLGYMFSKKQLCTVKLARKAFPGLRSYSLENLIRHFNISTERRHRALDDTLATVEIFQKIVRTEVGQSQIADNLRFGIKEAKLPNSITLPMLEAIPDACGVYYLHDAKGNVVYVGKSINIQKRVMEHFTDMTEKGDHIQRMVHDITYQLTGSELMALLVESHEIKRLKPAVNRAQRQATFPYVIHHFYNAAGYLCFNAVKVNARAAKSWHIVADYPKLSNAKSHLKAAAAHFQLCPILCHLEYSHPPCFHYHTKQCLGACIAEEAVLQYNERATLALAYLSKGSQESLLIVERGRDAYEQAVVWLHQGEVRGYGYISATEAYTDLSAITSQLTPCISNAELRRIVFGYLKHEPRTDTQVLRLSGDV